MKTITASIIVLIPLILSSCASTTTLYQVTNKSYGGFVEWREYGTTYRVVHIVKKDTPENRIRLLLEYRCAELTLEEGFTHYYEIPRPVQERFMYPSLLLNPQKRIVMANSLILGSGIEDIVNAVEELEHLKGQISP